MGSTFVSTRMRVLGLVSVVSVVSVVALLAVAIYLPGGLALAGELPPGGTFLDDDGNVHEGFIEAIAAAGITAGCDLDGDYYCPDDDVRRDQMASFLARALDLPDSSTDWFTDDNGNVHEDNINRVADAGITFGIGGGLYDPSASVRRDQMASFLARALGLPDSVTDWFVDDDDNIHEGNINKVADDGITLGCDSDGNYCPGDNVGRDQMASFLGRALDLVEMVPPPRPTTTTTTQATTTTTTSGSTTRFSVTSGNFFVPDDFSIPVGDTVQWTNSGGGFHDLAWVSGGFPGQPNTSTDPWVYAQTFNTAGSFDYYCTIHGDSDGAGMAGTVTVNS